MGAIISLERGRLWHRGLALGLCLLGLGPVLSAAAAPVDVTVACTSKNTYTKNQIKDDYDGIAHFLANAYALATMHNGNYVVCLKLEAALTIDNNIAIAATEAKPLVLLGLKAMGKGLTLSGSHVTLQDAQITVDVGTAITLTGSQHALYNVTLKGTKQAGSYGIQASGATQVVIEQSTLENFDRGIVVGAQSQITDTIVRWHYAEFPPAGMAATGTEALQLLGTKSVVSHATLHGFATGIAVSESDHVITGSSIIAYPFKLPPTKASDEVKQALQEKLQQHPGLDGVLITGSAHQLIPLITEVNGTQHATRNTIVGFATGIYLDGSATIRDNDITALQVGIQSETVPTQASVLYPNRFVSETSTGKKVLPYAFAEVAHPVDLGSVKMGKACTIDMVWQSDATMEGAWQICDEAATENRVHLLAAALPQSYCLATDLQIGLYEINKLGPDSQGVAQAWSFEPRGLCTITPFAEQTLLVQGASHETIAAGTCGVQCAHEDSGEPISLKMNTAVYPVLLSAQGAYPVVANGSHIAALFSLAMKDFSTVPGVGVTMTPTGGGEPGLVATGTDTGSLAAGGEITEVATASSDDEGSKAGVIDGSGFSGDALGTGLVSAGSGGGMKAGCSLVLP